MGKNIHGMLDHDKDKVLRLQFYARLYKRERNALNEHLKYIKNKDSINKSVWMRRAILTLLISEKKKRRVAKEYQTRGKLLIKNLARFKLPFKI